jgi:cell shape-determining protein MreD
MRKIICLVIGFLLILCETSFFSLLPLEILKPNLAVPFIIYSLFFLPSVYSLFAALLFGFIQEFLSAGPAGALIFVNLALFLSCLLLKSRLFIESRYTFSLVCAASVLFQCFLYIVISLFAKGETKDIFNVLLYCLPDAIVTGFVSLFLFSMFENMKVRYPGRV